MTTPSDQIWAYLHDELSPEEKVLFEQALQKDPGLREKLDECLITHNELKDLLPLPAKEAGSSDALAEKRLSEWEEDHPEYAETNTHETPRNILRLSLPLAAAAALVLLLTLPWNPSPTHWQRTAYGSAPQLRGEPIVQPLYTRAQLRQCGRELQDAVDAVSQQPEQWTLKLYLQELTNGALSVEVSGSRRGFSKGWKNKGVKAQPSSKVWKESFQGLEDFHQNVPRFGKQIADDLARQSLP